MSPAILAAIALVTYLSFTWAFIRFFRVKGSTTSSLLLQIKIWGGVAMIGHLVAIILFPATSLECSAGSFALFGLALMIFWWAIRTNIKKPLRIAFAAEGPEGLVRQGPYRIVRHPFYVSYMVAWLAGVVGSEMYLTIIPALVLCYLYYAAAKHEESQFLSSPMKNDYEAYRQKVGMFFPKLF